MTSWTAFLGEPQDNLPDRRSDAAAAFGIKTFTCDDCPAKTTCEWVYDPYNTDGDCLAEK